MTEARKQLVEEVAIALSQADPDSRGLPDGVTMAEFYRSLAQVAVALVGERMARVAETLEESLPSNCTCRYYAHKQGEICSEATSRNIAAAIRSLTQEE